MSITQILGKKGREKIVAITAYDALFASLFDEFVDIILVGDSLNMSFNAQKDTLNLGINEAIYHTKAVRNGVKKALLMADMPFGSYQSEKQALKNATKFIKQSGADCVKLEGEDRAISIIKKLTGEGIAVCGHIGLMPQNVRFEGGYKIKGRGYDEAKRLTEAALNLEAAGAFAIVLEGVISDTAKQITDALKIPTIGIGSGVDTDGQVLVFSDMLGLYQGFKPKFVKEYLDGKTLIKNAVKTYANEVKSQKFPTDEFSYKA
ncbi:3-methyl-2-oxobutanoate hydroxymethyltransferase [Campylobacter gastrosuis]|uniref:3-methyl-2-oxobutanoate hydroxymethyltransferase n=1 Tax=Campylobacter gastrosuis TaxID=2974576 RepID=A0ABT7HRP7_9BACT|nr:3-methyl-2-oxobutanoate hydroxymethyltransferase [Campylobacter gastrosuis]MDL0089514.1 3-methyl-2-oxobutanoate hydroxymethyltransferase [Campylobacter gastrosuis]